MAEPSKISRYEERLPASAREGFKSFAIITGMLNLMALVMQLGAGVVGGQVFTMSSALQESAEGAVQIGLAALLWQQSRSADTPDRRVLGLYALLFGVLLSISAYYDALSLPASAAGVIQPTWGAFTLLLHGALCRDMPRRLDAACIVWALGSIHGAVLIMSPGLMSAQVGLGALMWRAVLVWFPMFLCAVAIVSLRAMQARERRVLEQLRAALDQVGAYRLVRKLGEGGMGEVWLARHELLARPAAVKLVRPDPTAPLEGTQHDEVLRRFEREARLTASLSSLHTVRLYDFGEAAGGMRYYAMELLEGMTLEELVTRWGRQPEARVRAMLIQVCDSLAEAHEAGLTHRDIKPANIMLCRQGKQREIVKVLDFGLVLDHAQPAQRGHGDIVGTDARLTQKGMMMGTPATIAPEQAMALGTLDCRADLYSLGCVAYYMVTGVDVFAGTIDQILRHHIDTPPKPPSLCGDGVPLSAAFEVLILRCLSKKPEDRPQSAWEIRDELLRQQDKEQAQRWGEQQQAAWYAKHRPAGDQDPDATQESPSFGERLVVGRRFRA
jgi:hypothetical protein